MTVAQRITDRHNLACCQALQGGKLVFGPDGSGGEWYSAGAYGFAGLFVYPVQHRPVTVEQVQAWLDDREED